MVVTAVLGVRNEEAYLSNCLRHLVRNGIRFVIIDNGSTDASAEIYRRREFAGSLVDVVELPFRGVFSLAEQLRRKMAVVEAVDTDWVIHLDADEVMHSYRPSETLSEALSRLDAEGWNVVNFDEFVFLPIEHGYLPEAPGDQPMSLYYFFEPRSPRLMRAWRKAGSFSLVEHGGHALVGSDLRLAPESLALRHYIFRSQHHAFAKYATRTFAGDEIASGWHGNRIGQPAEAFRFPPARLLRRLSAPGDRNLDRSDPWPVHYWEHTARDR
ncbi:MAG TPA: glycosyltransferase family 2 protein [Beijerinckiaceae bacterium]|jgi:glycosyltransferase involved in cell wall biosynthesis